MSSARELRQRAERFLQLRGLIGDPAAEKAIREVASELEMTAEQLERQELIRERAHEIWIEHGCPENRDVEIWLAAEREVDIQRRR
jgi:Protein of unknown function (DUF2934)